MKTAKLFSCALLFYLWHSEHSNQRRESMRAFCKRAGISTSRFYAWYNGQSDIRSGTIERVAANLNIHPTCLTTVPSEGDIDFLPCPEEIRQRVLTT